MHRDLRSCQVAHVRIYRVPRWATVQNLSIFSLLTGSLPLRPASEEMLGSLVVHQVVAVLRRSRNEYEDEEMRNIMAMVFGKMKKTRMQKHAQNIYKMTMLLLYCKQVITFGL